jgi:GntR family transcriptional regulator|tara:strand:- start:1058 stop:1828 length:771 start_codon:yes stop_codon:yes gene_type:complete
MLQKISEKSLYVQLAEKIQQFIDTKKYNWGAKIPTEKSLSSKYKVSRITVRQALGRLEQRGTIIRKQGKGTFVKKLLIPQKFNRAKTIINVLESQGIKPNVKIIEYKEVSNDKFLRKKLHLNDSKLVFLKRLVKTGKIPIAVLKTYLPLAYKGVAEVIVRNGKINKKILTTYKVFENSLNIKIKEAVYTIKTTNADKSDAKLLKLKSNITCLQSDRLTISENKKPIEFTKFIYPSNYTEFEITLPRIDNNLLLRVK